jgi:hypothetical protein
MTPIAEIADFLTHLGDALSNITRGIATSIRHGYQTFDLVAARRAKKRLTRLHKYGTELGAIQVLMTRTMSWYLQEPTPAHWEEARADIQKVLAAIPDIVEEVREADSAFVIEPTYKEFLVAMTDRRLLLTSLLDIDPPTSAEELAELNQLRLKYYDLMDKLESLQCQLGEYIKTYYPRESRWLEDDSKT